MAKLKGLGRGLDALLGGEDNAAPPQGDLRMMNVAQLVPGKYQPRTQMDSESLQELADSKTTLEHILGNEVGSFAYPYGAWDARCAMAAKQVGYTAACTTDTGWARRDNDPYQLRRLTVFNTDTASMLARKLYFGSQDVRWRDIAGSRLRHALGH